MPPVTRPAAFERVDKVDDALQEGNFPSCGNTPQLALRRLLLKVVRLASQVAPRMSPVAPLKKAAAYRFLTVWNAAGDLSGGFAFMVENFSVHCLFGRFLYKMGKIANSNDSFR